jgi:hypothetical protein
LAEAATTDVASDDGSSIEGGSAAEMVDEACTVSTEVGACSFHCWSLVTVTKEVDRGADTDQTVETEPKNSSEDTCEELGGDSASNIVLKVLGMLVETGSSGWKNDATATASSTGIS